MRQEPLPVALPVGSVGASSLPRRQKSYDDGTGQLCFHRGEQLHLGGRLFTNALQPLSDLPQLGLALTRSNEVSRARYASSDSAIKS